MKILRAIAILGSVSLAVVAGCSSKHLDKRTGNGESLVFGYIDMEGAPTRLDGVSMKQVSPATDRPFWNLRVDDGMFYVENVPLGSYRVVQFNGVDALDLGICYVPCGIQSGASYNYKLPEYGEDGAGLIRIEKPGVYYLGSWKYSGVGNGLCLGIGFSVPKYDLLPTKTPAEPELLERLLPHAEKSGWNEPILARISELQAPPPAPTPVPTAPPAKKKPKTKPK